MRRPFSVLASIGPRVRAVQMHVVPRAVYLHSGHQRVLPHSDGGDHDVTIERRVPAVLAMPQSACPGHPDGIAPEERGGSRMVGEGDGPGTDPPADAPCGVSTRALRTCFDEHQAGDQVAVASRVSHVTVVDHSPA